MITYHHIGGRNGTYPLPLKKGPLLQDFHLILYDADENCYHQMQDVERNLWGKVSVYPFCIGGETGKGLFNLNFHPTTNSLYPFNSEYKDYNFVNYASYGEYNFGDACRHMGAIHLDLLSLPDALKKANVQNMDFLSLDVQGAEYDILYGAQSFLEKNCVGIQLEVEFVKLYQDQKVFSDMNQLLDSMGYELLELDSFGRCAPVSLPIGFRGMEQPLYAEATYIKKYNETPDDIDFLLKCAFFCLIYKKMGLCIRFLSKINTLDLQKDAFKSDVLYVRLLSEIWTLFKKHEHVKLPKLSQLFSHEKFQNYYSKSGEHVRAWQSHVMDEMTNHLSTIRDFANNDMHPLEEILLRYGLDDVACMVKKNRVHETNCFLELYGSLVSEQV